MKNSPHRRKHEMKKAIRQAQKMEYETEPKEVSEKTKKTYLSSPEKVKISKARASSKHKHHMTSPDEVTWETEPEHIHQEGKSWARKVQKRTLEHAQRVQKKLQKIRFKPK